MRNLSASALAKIANNLGNEPITIIEVEWIRDSNNKIAYAERDISTIPGQILEVSGLDNVINISSNSDSQEITVILNDTDSSIRDIMDENDIHKRNVWVYQWFETLDLDDKFLLFKGKINSPVVWSEGNRTVTFTIISQLEDREIGFSPEEGQFEEIPQDLIGQPWPMCFGTVIHSKTVRITSNSRGILGDGIGFPDFALSHRLQSLASIANYEIGPPHWTIQPYPEAWAQAQECAATLACQAPTKRERFRVFDGEFFPRGTITLKIGSANLLGHFEGDTNIFQLYYTGVSYRRNHPAYYEFANYARSNADTVFNQSCERTNWKILPHPEMTIRYVIGCGGTCLNQVSHFTGKVIGDNAGYVYLKPGTRVGMSTAEPQKFVVSIVPGEVLRVTAWAQHEGQKYLQDVPPNYYSVSTETFGTITAVIVTLDQSLSEYEDMGWEDDIYVTFKSDIGPNTIDIIEYLIQQYTDFEIDSTSFDHVRIKVDNYPSHFALYDRKNILNVLQEISWQARCSIYLKNDKFYIKYLPEQQIPVMTISKADVLTNTFELSHTDTEDIVTKMICKWKISPIQDQEFKTILRHNVSKYGTQEQEYDYYIYNFSDAVIKSATFWMIRYSNTWKKIQFQTPLTKLNLETLDSVTIDFIGIVANQSVLSIIEEVTYDSSDHSLFFSCWTPVKAGTMEPYLFAYPCEIDELAQFPTVWEIQEGFAGSGFTQNQGCRGFISVTGKTVGFKSTPADPYNFERGKNEHEELEGWGSRNNKDLGDPTPSDIDDVKPQFNIPSADYLGESSPGPQSIKLEGVTNFPPDGYGNDYPGGPSSGLTPGDTDSPGDFSPGDLPDPSDLPPNDCNFTVCVLYLDPVLHVGQGGWPYPEGYDQPGTIGWPVNGELTPMASREMYTFNSCTAAKAFAESMRNYANGENAVVGSKFPALVMGPYRGNTCTGIAVTICPPECTEPDDPAMIGFRPYGDGSGWSDFSGWAGENGQPDGSRF